MSGSSPTKEIDWKLLGYLLGFFYFYKTVDTEENLLTIHNLGGVNTTDIKIDYIDVATNGQTNCTIKIYKNPQVGGPVAYVAVPNSTIAEYDIAGTTIAGGDLLGIYSLSITSDRHIDLREHNIILAPDETFVVSGESPVNSTILVSVGWTERF